MPSILSTPDREALLRRLRQLQPTTPRRWGKLTAPEMICHIADAVRVAVGDLPVKRVDTLPTRTLVKWLVVYSPLSPPRGKIQTAPEMLSTRPSNWTEDLAAVEELVERIASTPTNARHPTFGPLTHDGWARLTWKHVDHHLRQFGC